MQVKAIRLPTKQQKRCPVKAVSQGYVIIFMEFPSSLFPEPHRIVRLRPCVNSVRILSLF